MTLMGMITDGPEVSLSGSSTVSFSRNPEKRVKQSYVDMPAEQRQITSPFTCF